jgi:bilirubin oxidase
VVRILNHGNRTSALHLHGSSSHAVFDGWAADELEVGQWKDYYYPNNEGARSIWYHDHAEHHTAVDAYEGQAGVYIVYDPKEDSLGLPCGKYDIPLALSDKTYQDNGQLVSIEGEEIGFLGEFIQVNEQPWPFLEVEPRKYRFRIYDMSVSRPYDLYLVDEDGNWLDFQVIASDSGLFGHPVLTNDLTISMGERYEIVVDFSGVRGQNITLANKLQNPTIVDFENTDKVMRFVVGNTVTDSNDNGPVPDVLNPDLAFPKKEDQTEVDRKFNFQQGGDAAWTINGIAFSDPNARVLARMPQGTVELWELRHTGGGGVHPVHIHLISFQVVSRSGGPRGLLPYETAGLKDTVFLQPGEVVQVLAYFGPWNGVYMFHCHNLVHEDHEMMAAFNVTLLEELGYDFESTQGYDNPDGTEFSAADFSDEAYGDDAKHSVVRSLGSLNAYQPATSLVAALGNYYTANGNQQEASSTVTSQTKSSVMPLSAGAFFEPSATSEAMPGFEAALPTINLLSDLSLPSLLARDASPTWQTLVRPTASPATTAAPSRK